MKFNFSSKFGNRKYYNNKLGKYVSDFHSGVDITNYANIICFFRGKVTEVRNNIKGFSTQYSAGNYIVMKHDNNTYTKYCHMKYNSIKVKVGDILEVGSYIGERGATGNATGPHLHFSVKVNGKYVDPMDYLNGKKSITYNGSAVKKESNQNTNTNTNANSNPLMYTIKKGDNLTRIANKYNTTWKKIYELNKDLIGPNPNFIRIGDVIKIHE